MTPDYHTLLGIAAALINLCGYLPYIRNILLGKTKPHPFTWFVWGSLTGIGFFAQLAAGAGTGAWILGAASFECLLTAVLALRWGEKRITALDWCCFAGALGSLILWQLTANPLLAVILVTLTDGLAFVPTYRKAYVRPNEETITTFALGVVAFSISLVALQSFNLTSALYPAFIAISNFAFVVMLLIRRAAVGRRLPNTQ